MNDKSKPNANMQRFQEAARKAAAQRQAQGGGAKPAAASRRPATKSHAHTALPKRISEVTYLGKALLVIPDARVATMLANQTKAIRLEPEIIANGQDAVTLMESGVPDLIIIDKDLADIPGYSCCSRIRAVPAAAEVPIIISTSDKIDESSEMQAMMIGASGLVSKPFVIPQLLAKIRELVNYQELMERSHNAAASSEDSGEPEAEA